MSGFANGFAAMKDNFNFHILYGAKLATLKSEIIGGPRVGKSMSKDSFSISTTDHPYMILGNALALKQLVWLKSDCRTMRH